MEPNPPVPVPVAAAAIKVPIFNHADPALWFCMCESTFQLGTPKPITDPKTKYNYCVANLPPETASLVRDVLMNPNSEDPYKALKDALIARSGESAHQEIRKLLQGENIGDRKPTELLRVLKRRAEAHNVPDSLMLEIFLQHLPSHVQTVLAAVPKLEMDQAADIADRVMDVTPLAVSACSAAPPPNSNDLMIEIQKLSARIDEISRGRSRARSFSQNRRRSQSNNKKHDMCWFHFKFGDKARNCNKPCSFESKNEDRQG